MHNFSIALNPTASQLRTNLEVVEKAVNDDIYRVWLLPEQMDDAGLAGAASYVKYASTPVPSHWLLPDAVTSGITFLLPRHPQWKYGMAYLTAIYSVDGTSAGNLSWRVRTSAYEEGTVFAAASGNVIPLAAPTTASTLHKLDIVSATASTGFFQVSGEHIGHQIFLERVGGAAGDTSTDDLRIHAVIVTYQESRRQL